MLPEAARRIYVEPCIDTARDCIETYIEPYIDIIKIIVVFIPDRSL